MVHAGDFDCRPADAVGDDVGRFRDYEFARARHAPRRPELGVLREQMLHAIEDVERDALRGSRIILRDMRAQ